MQTKPALYSTTILGLLTAAAGTGGVVPAAVPNASTWDLVLQIVGLVLALWGRWKHGDLTILPAKPPVPPAALVICTLALGASTATCVAPASEQGHAAQGGSTGLQPVVNVTLTFGRDVKVDGLSSGTAAPSAASEAQNRQDGKLETNIDPKSVGEGVGKVLGAPKLPVTPVVPSPAPVVAPAEIVAPAPVPAPAPTVPEAPAPEKEPK